ncbi:iron ABC transporter substrate-binding protein [Arthrobacter alpinus]|uniref:Iron ABC transporter substrate-binding protein n=1 Tax=Arthrobacter alpinus TaxID=656366 RepID=A0A0S2LX90_9MICC|nr:ABC transporter substrate-binding protein [Arthrobacter alpinus]ALO66066.1 iron ABC transporter substrate-binding protein [Arthrobacter alpinus]
MLKKHLLTLAATAAVLALTACGAEAPSGASEESTAAPTSVTVEDNNGSQTINLPLKSVVATDNRTFETLSDWGVKLTAGAVTLMPKTSAYKTDTSIIDLGSHREPNLEAVVAVEPDLIVNGQRYAQFHDDLVKFAPKATVLELDPRDGESYDAELKRQTTVLGEVFGKQAEAKKLNNDLDAAIARAKKAYPKGSTVMALITSGGNINYAAPGNGRSLGPVFDILGLTPALEVKDASTDHQGDDISVEAIADSNPDWIIAMDRDAATSADDPKYVAGKELLTKSAALKNVTASKQGNVVFMPNDSYTNEGIQTYTEFFNSIADAFEGK